MDSYVSHDERQRAINALKSCEDYHDLNKWSLDTSPDVRRDPEVDEQLMYTRARLIKAVHIPKYSQR